MYYRMLGNTGLQVSVLSYGFWATFGVKEGLTEEQGIAAAKEILQAARQGGVNLFDNAEAYGNPNGEAEAIMGAAIAQLAEEHPELWDRSEIVVTTKIFWGGRGVNQVGLSRKHIMEGLDRALSRPAGPLRRSRLLPPARSLHPDRDGGAGDDRHGAVGACHRVGHERVVGPADHRGGVARPLPGSRATPVRAAPVQPDPPAAARAGVRAALPAALQPRADHLGAHSPRASSPESTTTGFPRVRA